VEYYSSLLVKVKDFWSKNTTGRSPRGLVLARQCPSSPGTCNLEETGLPGLPISWSSILFSGSGPIGIPSVPWTETTTERSPVFITWRSTLLQRPGWMDNLLNFFLSGLQKSEQRAKRCIEFRGEYVE
jgi:hypothetical protein